MGKLEVIVALILALLKRLWPTDSDEIKAIKAKMRENRYAIMRALNRTPAPKDPPILELIAERSRLSEELDAARAK